ncbi:MULTISPECIES: MGMT family protein [Pseudoalteromonas]|uniref:MGMT family protein n=1 Tax=Pseudoalteromonas haloplanktis TaxID=228 RepID=A0ABU1B6X0_PSEHA|nr:MULTISPECIES: MGMT family protein [Pseudoalteromonas]MCF6146870.1 methylated-DNA-protein-cysteine methyltransferase related protein [Pseudoalteromonas mariniglutinosa NCIMB 1770]MDQ9089972.1 MGMT family protein [Pseudoalteromonas haloplanktis]TMN73324.1 cysteine methyltransferase [Pseudoalteromonas sp. S1727]
MTDISKEDKIYTVMANIPKGCVASYGQVATMAGLPNNARLVGRLLKLMPKDSVIPWHRVINSQGKISFPEGSPQYLKQYQLLLSEGIIFKSGKVNMRIYRW